MTSSPLDTETAPDVRDLDSDDNGTGLPLQTRVSASHAAGQALKRSALRPSAEGRAPLGAPPWRFLAVGRASVCGIILRNPCSELLAARS